MHKWSTLLIGIMILFLAGGCAPGEKLLVLPAAAGPIPGIAFVSERSGSQDIFLIQPDGSGLTPLFASPRVESDPDWSPDGTRIAFRSRRDGSSEIYIAAADGTGDWLNLINDPAASFDDEFSPKWHPSGNLLAIYTDRFLPPMGDCKSQLGVHHLAFIPLDLPAAAIKHFDDLAGEQKTLAWSPDGRILAFSSICTGNFFRIYLWNRETREIKTITEDSYASGSVDFSPDGGLLAFSSNRDGSSDIFLYEMDSGEIRNLTQSGFIDRHPSWSPDGNWIAFTRTVDGNEDIYLISVQNGEVRRVTHHPSRDFLPAWSPAGSEE